MKIARDVFLILGLLLPACTSNKTNYQLDLPGPTLAARVPEGYELKNRHMRVVIDGTTGDVIYFGSRDGRQNLLISQPIQTAILSTTQPGGFTLSHSTGYVEARDDQTWQYLGEDSVNKIGWRKIYCLNGDDLNVSFLSQNEKPDAQTLCLGLSAGENFPTYISQPDAEHYIAANAIGTVEFHAYNEYHNQPANPPLLIIGDAHLLRPNEKISWTMQWHGHVTAPSPASQPSSQNP